MKSLLKTIFLFLPCILQMFLVQGDGTQYSAWTAVGAIAGIGSALFGGYNAVKASKSAKRAGELQAQQALDNAQKQAEDAFRKAEEVAYQNMLQIQDLQAQSAFLQYSALYQQDVKTLQLDDMMIDFGNQIDFLEFDKESIGLSTDYQVAQNIAQAEIFGIRAGVSAQAASALREIGNNIVEELDIARALNELKVFDLKKDAENAINDVDYQVKSARYESRISIYKGKVNAANAITALTKTETEADLLRRDNFRTLGVVAARLATRGSVSTGSARDVVQDRQRESREQVQLKYLTGQIEANSYAIASKLNMYSAELSKREAAFLGNKKIQIAQDVLRTEQMQRTAFGITELGYENRLIQNVQSIVEAEAASAIYSMQAGMSIATADYIQQVGANNIAELEFKQSVLRGEADRMFDLAMLDIDHTNKVAQYNMGRVATTISNLNEGTSRAREEAKWLANKYMDSAKKGYNYYIEMGNIESSRYMAQAIGNVSSAINQFATWNPFGPDDGP